MPSINVDVEEPETLHPNRGSLDTDCSSIQLSEDMMLLANPALRAGARLTISVDKTRRRIKKALHAYVIFFRAPLSRGDTNPNTALAKNCCRSQWLECKHLYTTSNQSNLPEENKTASLSQRQTRPSLFGAHVGIYQ